MSKINIKYELYGNPGELNIDKITSIEAVVPPVPEPEPTPEPTPEPVYEAIDTTDLLSSISQARRAFPGGKPPYEILGDDQIVAIAENMLTYQYRDGGWPQNIDWMKQNTDDELAALRLSYSGIDGGSLDNKATWSQIRYLTETHRQTGSVRYANAARRGVAWIISQRHPVSGGFSDYYGNLTFNDHVMSGVMNLFIDIEQQRELYSFVTGVLLDDVSMALKRMIHTVLRSQVVINVRPTIWAQQYDHETLTPVKARKQEQPAISAWESADVLSMLMRLENPSQAAQQAIHAAAAWYKNAAISGIRLESFPAEPITEYGRLIENDRRLVDDPAAPLMWSRFYSLETGKPVFFDRQSNTLHSFAELSRELRTGYGWYGYWGHEVLAKYADWAKRFPAPEPAPTPEPEPEPAPLYGEPTLRDKSVPWEPLELLTAEHWDIDTEYLAKSNNVIWLENGYVGISEEVDPGERMIHEVAQNAAQLRYLASLGNRAIQLVPGQVYDLDFADAQLKVASDTTIYTPFGDPPAVLLATPSGAVDSWRSMVLLYHSEDVTFGNVHFRIQAKTWVDWNQEGRAITIDKGRNIAFIACKFSGEHMGRMVCTSGSSPTENLLLSHIDASTTTDNADETLQNIGGFSYRSLDFADSLISNVVIQDSVIWGQPHGMQSHNIRCPWVNGLYIRRCHLRAGQTDRTFKSTVKLGGRGQNNVRIEDSYIEGTLTLYQATDAEESGNAGYVKDVQINRCTIHRLDGVHKDARLYDVKIKDCIGATYAPRYMTEAHDPFFYGIPDNVFNSEIHILTS